MQQPLEVNAVVLSQKMIINANNERKRAFRPDTWKDQVTKQRRARGAPYISRNNTP